MSVASSSLESLRDKLIDPDDDGFIESLVSDNHQEVYWKGWVQIYTKANAAAKKERILVLTNFRLFTVKHGAFGKSTRQSFPILDLTHISAPKSADKCDHLHLEFKNKELLDVLADPEVIVRITQTIMFAFKAITYGFPKERLPQVDVPPPFLENWDAPEVDTQDGLLASYLAACDYFGTAPKLPILDYFMTSFEISDRVFDLGDCLEKVEKASQADIQSLAAALLYTDWFEEFICMDYALKDDGVSALADIFQEAPHLFKCVMVNVKAGAKGFGTLAERLASPHHGVVYLNVSKNPIGDGGVKTLLESFSKSGRVLDTLCLQACGFSGQGFRDLATVIATEKWRKTLRILDVSDNKATQRGSDALAEYVAEAESLQQLYCMRADLNLELLFNALKANPRLSGSVLTTLNLSGNKFTKQAVSTLREVLLTSKSITHLYLVGCQLPRQAVTEIVEAAIQNPFGVRYWLELSNNDLGPKGAKELASLFEARTPVKTIHTLILNGNNMGVEGLVALVTSLTGTDINTLSVDGNIKSGLFAGSQVKDVGEAVATFMNRTPSLRELSIAGDDHHYLKSSGYPILQALGTNTSLRHLDISRNRLGDEGMRVLAEALRQNKSLTSFNAERNRIGIKGLRELHAAMKDNTTLTEWVIPLSDIEAIFKKGGTSVKFVKELRQLVYDFDSIMERNQSLQHAKDDASKVQQGAEAEKQGADGWSAVESRRRQNTQKMRRHSRNASNMVDNMVIANIDMLKSGAAASNTEFLGEGDSESMDPDTESHVSQDKAD